MNILKRFRWLSLSVLMVLMVACADDDTFSSAPNQMLDFSTDTLRLDTCFSTIPTPAKSFWVYNRSGAGIRLESVRLERGNQSGFRVNIDGIYLGGQTGWQTNQVEIRNKDSVRVFVEMTSALNYQSEPVKVEDHLVFTLENGNVQRVNLLTHTWDATLLEYARVSNDSIIDSPERPVVIYGGLRVDSLATLRIAAGTTLYFHNDAGMDVYGTLIAEGTPERQVTLRGDRIDRIFEYLPYDRLAGQWQGLRFHTSSYDNVLRHTDLHGAYNGIVCDSSDVERHTLLVEASTIHNCQGHGLVSRNSRITVLNTQVTNTLGDCLAIFGGLAEVNHCTLAQFYPFDANRGVALRFTADEWPLYGLDCKNSLITGYGDDQMMGQGGDEQTPFNYAFDHCIIRTPVIATDDSIYFTNVIYEDVKDTLSTGRKHFVTFDTDNFIYDFHLDSISPAIGKANPLTSMPLDHDGKKRDDQPDIGAYERLVKHEE